VILRYLLHLEWHCGYRPTVKMRRAPREGDRVVDGGEPGTLVRCRGCGAGFLHQMDRPLEPTVPAEGPTS
jgi:hypothetical protein